MIISNKTHMKIVQKALRGCKLDEQSLNSIFDKLSGYWSNKQTKQRDYTINAGLQHDENIKVYCTTFYHGQSRLKIYYCMSDDTINQTIESKKNKCLEALETFIHNGWTVNAEFTIDTSQLKFYLKPIKSLRHIMFPNFYGFATAHKQDRMVRMCASRYGGDYAVRYKSYINVSNTGKHYRLMFNTGDINCALAIKPALTIANAEPISFDADPISLMPSGILRSNSIILYISILGFASQISDYLLMLNDSCSDPDKSVWIILSVRTKCGVYKIGTTGTDFIFLNGEKYLMPEKCFANFSTHDYDMIKCAIDKFVNKMAFS